ncbi:hypothetical protein [Litchfieldia alkalitelluris]|uniref:hypothetical protein n=1 Tax=Litchfieldia alkalitelluris TaxID=304268 RepID=UPI000996D31A|nr:hypothetical protein [Litchfieldia alkalitelluris]
MGYLGNTKWIYSEGEWIIEPSIENFYNPTDIVKVRPSIRMTKEEVKSDDEEIIAEFNSLMKDVKSISVKFHKKGRMPELEAVATVFYGKGKKISTATIDDMEIIKQAYEKLLEVYGEEEEMPDL